MIDHSFPLVQWNFVERVNYNTYILLYSFTYCLIERAIVQK